MTNTTTLFPHFQPYNKNINSLCTYKKVLLKLDNQTFESI